MRPWMSRRAAERQTRELLGKGSVNSDKRDVEGEPSEQQIMWGLTFNTKNRTVGMPEVKLLKAQYVFGDPEIDFGAKKVRVHTLQVLRGNGEWFAIVQPSMRPWLAVLDVLMKGVRPGQVFVYLTVDNEEIWREFEELVEAFRVMVARPELWAQDFTVSITNLLTPEERLAIPGEIGRVVWTGGGRHPRPLLFHRLDGLHVLCAPR